MKELESRLISKHRLVFEVSELTACVPSFHPRVE